MNKQEIRTIQVTGEEMKIILDYMYDVSKGYSKNEKLTKNAVKEIERFRSIWEDGEIIGYTE